MRFTRSLRGRLAIYFALAIMASLLISGFLSVGLVLRYLQQKTVSDLEFQAQTLSTQIQDEGLPQRRYIDDLESMYGTRALIIPYHDQAIGQLPPPPADPAVLTPRALQTIDWNLLGQNGTQVLQAQVPGLDRERIVVAHGITVNGQLAGAVVLAKPLTLLQSWRPLAGYFLIGAAASLALSLLLSFLLARRLSRPIKDLTGAATAVAAGDFSTEVKVSTRDEIGRLADAFNHMSGEVQKSQEQQRQFVINVSHELKTPLTAIAGHTQALRDGIASDPEAIAGSLKVIDAETRRLSRLIEDLLSLAKFDSAQFGLRHASVSAPEVSQAVVDSLSHQAQERGVRLTANASSQPEDRVKLDTDPDRLRQILANLIQNALAHTGRGGDVTLTTRGIDHSVEIEVADNGEGISAEDLPHVFDRFYQSSKGKSAKGGLGLGLSISRELARAMGGDISAQSIPGGGSSFTVSLPR